MKKRVFSIRIDDETVRRLETIALNEQRSLGAQAIFGRGEEPDGA
jgi:predicted transcriptional regulator